MKAISAFSGKPSEELEEIRNQLGNARETQKSLRRDKSGFESKKKKKTTTDYVVVCLPLLIMTVFALSTECSPWPYFS